MIKIFRHKGLSELFDSGKSRLIPADMHKRILRRLDVLDAAQTINGVNVPGFNLHALKGNRTGEWSITVTGNYRITFRFDGGDVHDLNLEDYH